MKRPLGSAFKNSKRVKLRLKQDLRVKKDADREVRKKVLLSRLTLHMQDGPSISAATAVLKYFH